MFEQLSGLKINFSTYSFFAKAMENIYAHICTSKVGAFPFKYLGVHIHINKLAYSDWPKTEDKVVCWKDYPNYIGNRIILI